MALSKKAKEILNRPDLIEKRDLWFSRMQNVFDNADDPWNNTYTFSVNGIRAEGVHDLYTEPELWVEDCLENLAQQYSLIENEAYFRPLCVEYYAYVVHYVDKIFGAEVFNQGWQWFNRQLTTPIGQLKTPDLENDPVWSATRRAMNAFLEAEVSLPLFGLPTYASALNIIVNLYGENILVAMLEEPEAAAADLRVINDLICTLHRKSRSIIPMQQLQPVISWNRTQPPGYGQLCGCTTQLLSGPLYQELIAPLDDELLSVYPNGGMIHICGSHTQHMEAFRNMKSLKAIQVNDRAAADLQAYYEGLREDQILYLNACSEMTVEKAMEITGGHRLVIAGDISAPVLRR